MNSINEECVRLKKDRAEFFARAFENMNVPPDIRRAAELITSAYGLWGECDPGYIANIIALETGRGDGKGNFNFSSPAKAKGDQ